MLPPKLHVWTAAMVIALLSNSPALHSQDLDQELFETVIRPTLIANCLECHATDTEASGGLLLDSRDGWEAGGDSGAAIVPGEATASLLMEAISYESPDLQMPPEGKLPDHIIAQFRTWIERGANDPRRGSAQMKNESPGGLSVARAQEHWAYRRIQAPILPADSQSNTAIDHFVDSKLAEAGLSAGTSAPRASLARRLYSDLHGLPPTPDQLAAFVEDNSPEAYNTLVDRLLASPRFGETFARHWMDVARYADSITLRGFVLPQAWRYRDYLIRSYNDDRPFDRMMREQVAGDLMAAADLHNRQQQLIATGFLVLGNTNLEQQDKAQLEMDYIDEQLQVIGHAFLGQTIGCARCHDHKFDPIPTADYYALAGLLRPSVALDHDNVSKWIERPLPLAARQEQHYAELRKASRDLEKQAAQLKTQLGELDANRPQRFSVEHFSGTVIDSSEARLVGKWSHSVFSKPYIGDGYLHTGNPPETTGRLTATFEPESIAPGIYDVRLAYTSNSNRASRAKVHVFSSDGEKIVRVNQRKKPTEDSLWFSLGRFRFERDGQAYVLVSNEDANGVVIVDAVQFLPVSEPAESLKTDDPPSDSVAELRRQLKLLEQQQKQIANQLAQRPSFITLEEQNKPQNVAIHIRGDVHNLGESVPRGFLTAVEPPHRSIAADSSGRLEFATWLTSPENPLPARVYANRIWQWLMGQGLVATPNNFGTTGALPSHPELLDWLAMDLINHNWSTKHLVRTIVLSDAYRRERLPPTADHLARDPDNRLIWTSSLRRLTPEALRDAMLLVSGELDFEMGGSLISKGTTSDYGYDHRTTRRSVYHPVFRNSLPELFDAFDFANSSVPIGKRARSTVATQGLVLMNHPWVAERVQATYQRLMREHPPETDWSLEVQSGVVDSLYQTCLARKPTPAELNISLNHLGQEGTPSERATKLKQLIHSLLASIDFRYLD